MNEEVRELAERLLHTGFDALPEKLARLSTQQLAELLTTQNEQIRLLSALVEGRASG